MKYTATYIHKHVQNSVRIKTEVNQKTKRVNYLKQGVHRRYTKS